MKSCSRIIAVLKLRCTTIRPILLGLTLIALSTVTAHSQTYKGSELYGRPLKHILWEQQTPSDDNRYCPETGTWTGGRIDGPATLPEDCFNTAIANTPSPGSTIIVPAGADLSLAYSTTQCGQTLMLAHGASWSGPFSFSSKGCDDQHWITITVDGVIPSEGVRITPAISGQLARIVLKSGSSPNTFGDHLRFIGIEWAKQRGGPLTAMLNTTDATKVIFDRNYCHGNSGEETRRCLDIGSNSSYIAVIHSYLSRFHCIAVTGTCTDSQAISGGTGEVSTVHGIKIVDNFLEAAAENILFGGGAADGCGPNDVEIRRNLLYKPMNWNPRNATYGQIPYVVKNLLELKNGCRILLEGNVLAGSWGGYSQRGWAIAVDPKNQSGSDDSNICPACTVTDLTIRYSYIHHAAGGVLIANSVSDNGGWSAGGGRYSIHDIIADGLQYPTCYECGTDLNEIVSGYTKTNPPPPTEILHDVLLNHVTEIANSFLAPPGIQSAMLILDGPPRENPTNTPQITNVQVMNSIFAYGSQGSYSTGGGVDNCATVARNQLSDDITTCWAGDSAFSANILVGEPNPDSSLPGGNSFVADWAQLNFVNYNNGDGGNYHLAYDSPFRDTATDGSDPGADVDLVLDMIAHSW
jgi:hypothetical protein